MSKEKKQVVLIIIGIVICIVGIGSIIFFPKQDDEYIKIEDEQNTAIQFTEECPDQENRKKEKDKIEEDNSNIRNDNGMSNTYSTRYQSMTGIDSPVFCFDYPDGWAVCGGRRGRGNRDFGKLQIGSIEHLHEEAEEVYRMMSMSAIYQLERNRLKYVVVQGGKNRPLDCYIYISK